MYEPIDWSEFGVFDENIPDDWQYVLEVRDVNSSGGWAELYVFYSPRVRRFYWLGSSGCSCCYSWGEEIKSENDFYSGTRDKLAQDIHMFTALHGSHDFDTMEVIAKLVRFRP